MRYSRLLRTVSSIFFVVVFLSACAAMESKNQFSYKDLPVSKANVEGSTVAFRGTPQKLEGNTVRVGESLRDAKLTASDMKPLSLPDTHGKVRIVSIVPSVDTKVCEQQTHYLSEKIGPLDQSVQLITVSVDTPFALKRFAEEAKISNITFLSDYRGGEFGRAHGLLIPSMHVLARSVMVVDRDNVIRYLQIVPELGNLPDMEAAFAAARLLTSSSHPAHPSRAETRPFPDAPARPPAGAAMDGRY
jgi:thioredoxin-dependent peroxiredoxin